MSEYVRAVMISAVVTAAVWYVALPVKTLELPRLHRIVECHPDATRGLYIYLDRDSTALRSRKGAVLESCLESYGHQVRRAWRDIQAGKTHSPSGHPYNNVAFGSTIKSAETGNSNIYMGPKTAVGLTQPEDER